MFATQQHEHTVDRYILLIDVKRIYKINSKHELQRRSSPPIGLTDGDVGDGNAFLVPLIVPP